MSFIDGLLARTPGPVRRLALRHHELIKFALVGGTTMVFDMAIFYGLSLTVLEAKPVVAKVISGTLATILSYFLNREWAFKNRGGRETHHEALLFFVISGIGVVLQAAPLWFANNVLDMRTHLPFAQLVVVDFVLGYIIGNILQMAFRFWALRKFAFPETRGHEDAEIEALATGQVTIDPGVEPDRTPGV
ncbi:GtrA family protein [Williamsia deligens]|uniref:GtrA family protein n=1 Tax=Williamsia deligens TaxID=321325 RepID=A0ABW3GCC9_9NOCA|nr:GtrA family protein [Williamsia deligens]MCP2196201.1 putative flippase GtrA (transmembrane translocase of bactoprenol-linked glucose) [Williamsia deligens]